MTVNLAAVVLAGGRAERLGGTDKLMLPVGGRPLLERTLTALAGADPLVVVGPRRELPGRIRWTREDPSGSGPLAGVDAGLRELPASVDLVAVLAADHPYLTSATIARLVAALQRCPAAAGAVLVDRQARPQWLVGVWKLKRLRAGMPADPRDLSARSLFGMLEPERVPASGAESSDVDTAADLLRAEEGG